MIAAGVLLVSAVSAVMHGEHLLWACLEIAVSLSLMIVILRHMRHMGDGAHQHQIGWVEITCGLFLLFEAYAKTHEGRHSQLFVFVSYLPGVIFIALGLFEGKVRRHLYVRAHEDRLEANLTRFSRFELPWSDVESFRSERRQVVIGTRSGEEKKIRVNRYREAKELRAWLTAQLERRIQPQRA